MSLRSRTRLRLGVSGACMAGLLLAGCTGNSLQTADRGLDPLGDPLVALGLKADPDREVIEYGPRPPLVIPGSNELPEPQQRLAMADPSWPDDPDIRAREEYEAARRAAAEQSVSDVEHASRRMSRAELDEWGRRFGRIADDPPTVSDPSRAVHPDELRARTASAEDAAALEPPRRRLTDPPAGYRQRADTDEIVEEEEERGFFARLFTGRSAPPPPRTSSDPRYDPVRDN